jgi:thiaminase/transcriptional activator TenA
MLKSQVGHHQIIRNIQIISPVLEGWDLGVVSFSKTLRQEADHIWEGIFGHPFLVELEGGTLPLDKFRFYVKQDYSYLMEFARCLGLATAKVEEEMMSAFASLLNASLTVEVEMLERLSEKLGIPRDQLKTAEPAPTNLAYTRHLITVAYSGTVGEVMAAMLPCMWSYQEIGERLGESKSMVKQPVYKEWVATYRSQEYIELVDWYRSLVDRFASDSGGLVREKMRRHFVLSSRYEYMFWDMAYREEGWPI